MEGLVQRLSRGDSGPVVGGMEGAADGAGTGGIDGVEDGDAFGGAGRDLAIVHDVVAADAAADDGDSVPVMSWAPEPMVRVAGVTPWPMGR